MALARRALAVWLVLIVVEVIHGTLRRFFVTPYAGEFRSSQIGAVTGSLLVVGVAYVFIGWIGAPSPAALRAIGLAWLGLTLAFEFGFGHYVFGRSWDSLMADYRLSDGGLLGIGMFVLAFSPRIATWLRRWSSPSGCGTRSG